MTTTPALERLTRQGVVARPSNPSRPTATGRDRPRARRPVFDVVREQRDGRASTVLAVD